MKQRHRGRSRRRRRVVLTAFCVGLAAIMLALALYIGYWYFNLGRIRAQSDRYAALYPGTGASASPAAAQATAHTVAPTPTSASTPTSSPTATATSTPTAMPTPTPSNTPEPKPAAATAPPPSTFASVAPSPTATPVPSPAVAPTATQAPPPAPEVLAPGSEMPIVEDVPIPTPDSGTLVIALPTPPPVQSSFDALVAVNPDTVGFLDIEGLLSLPVVQRENDNDFYLTHDFEGREAREGSLFLDGMNRLVPEDDCLIVYGHNMKNDTMFGKLDAFKSLAYLRQHPVVRFDTLYENRSYVAFAAFSASMETGDRRYFDVRHFIFDDVEFDKFVLKLQSRSMFRIPVDVVYGDRLLLLVTCDYADREGRFLLALRQLREDETEADAWAKAMQSVVK